MALGALAQRQRLFDAGVVSMIVCVFQSLIVFCVHEHGSNEYFLIYCTYM